MFVVSTTWRTAPGKEMVDFKHIANVFDSLTLRTMRVKPPLQDAFKVFSKNITPRQQ